jgi:hypothetical protein
VVVPLLELPPLPLPVLEPAVPLLLPPVLELALPFVLPPLLVPLLLPFPLLEEPLLPEPPLDPLLPSPLGELESPHARGASIAVDTTRIHIAWEVRMRGLLTPRPRAPT